MKYTIAKMFQILRHNRWVSILMIIEIALGMSVFTYSLVWHMNAIYKIAEFYAAILLCNIYY